MSEAKRSEGPETSPKKLKKTEAGEDFFCPEIIIGEALQEHLRRLEARDRKSLFLSGISASVSDEDVKALSEEIISIRRPRFNYCFLEFVSEDVAEKNINRIQKKIKGKDFLVDYVGSKSSLEKDSKKVIEQLTVNKLKLQVKGLDADVTEGDLQAEFPDAVHVEINATSRTSVNAKHSHIGFLTFKDKELAKRAYDSSAEKVIKGRPVVVVYSLPSNKQKQIKKEKKDKKLSEIQLRRKNKKKELKKRKNLSKDKI